MNTAVSTPTAPAAVGAYSQAVDTGKLVFCSGQLGIDPASGEMAPGAAAQADQAITNLAAVLAAARLTLADVVKTTVFLADIADFAEVNAVYADRFMDSVLPARSAIQAAALPKAARVEIEAIAARP